MNLPRFMIAAASSGSGKTTITCGLLECMKRRGLHPVSFKCGPDYIDPMFHQTVLGVPSRNLDLFFTEEKQTRRLMAHGCKGGDYTLLEGVMGYYDGLGITSTQASSYDLARVTRTPVLLVVNARGMSLSIAALLKGFLSYRKDHNIRGILLNQTTERVFQQLSPLLEKELGVPVFGYLPVLKDCRMESRHLGLLLPEEIEGLQEKIGMIADKLEECVKLDALFSMGEQAEELKSEGESVSVHPTGISSEEKKTRIAVAKDAAFRFYYADNLELLEELGAELVFFSPLQDRTLPENCDGLLLGGGYPELYLEQLSENETMRISIRHAIRSGMPYLAECGGFLYLHERMQTKDGRKSFPMVGVFPGEPWNKGKLGCFGYITLESEVTERAMLAGMKAHEFHYYDSPDNGCAVTAKKPGSDRQWQTLHVTNHSVAGFPHLYYQSKPDFVLWFLEQCKK